MSELPAEMVEAAAEALCVFQRNAHVDIDGSRPTWDTTSAAHKAVHRKEAIRALEAAGVPALLAQLAQPSPMSAPSVEVIGPRQGEAKSTVKTGSASPPGEGNSPPKGGK